MSQLQTMYIKYFVTANGAIVKELPLSYQLFGKPLHTAPIVLVNHALTGNSQVTSANGWWKTIIGDGKVIDTLQYTVIAFNVPGNGYDGYQIENYKNFVGADIANLFLKGLFALHIKKVTLMIGGSLGGSLGWQMVEKAPDLFEHFVPIACDWKTTDWVLAQCNIQDAILTNSSRPIQDARMHAMTFYRSPASFFHKFNRKKTKDGEKYEVLDWLLYHGETLAQRFTKSSYLLLNHLLSTINNSRETDDFYNAIKKVTSHIHLVGIPTDGLFVYIEIENTYNILKQHNKKVSLHSIDSIHGHDAFLIEYPQLINILEPIMEAIHKNMKTHEYNY